MITYEYPFNELVRSLLRLEYLFDRFNYYVEKDDARDMHQAISIIFDLGEITARADLKSSLMKELDRQRNIDKDVKTTRDKLPPHFRVAPNQGANT